MEFSTIPEQHFGSLRSDHKVLNKATEIKEPNKQTPNFLRTNTGKYKK